MADAPSAPSAPPRRKLPRWKLGSLVFAVVAAVGAAAWESATRWSARNDAGTATALLHVDHIQPWIAFEPTRESSWKDKETWEAYQNTQVALARSRLVLNAALRNPAYKVAATGWYRDVSQEGEPSEWLEARVRADFSLSPEIMQISISYGSHFEDLPVLVDAIVAAYLEEIVEKDNNRRRQRYEQLCEIAHQFEAQIKKIRTSLRQIQEDVGPGDKNVLAIRQDQARSEYDLARTELAQVRSELRRLKLQVEAAERGIALDPIVPPVDVLAILDQDALLKKYADEQQKLEDAIEAVKAQSDKGDNEPALIRDRAALAQLKEKAGKHRKQLIADVEARLQDNAAKDAKSKQMVSRQRLKYLTEFEKALVKDIERLGKEVKGGIKQTLDLTEVEREMAGKEELLREVQKQAAILEVELQAPPRVKKLQDAVLRKKVAW
jgi:hypothetical protein